MSITAYPSGQTDVTTYWIAYNNTTGARRTDITSASSGLTITYTRNRTADTSVSPTSLAADDTAHTDGGVRHIAGGLMRIDWPDAAFTTGVDFVVLDVYGVTDTVFVPAGGAIDILGANPRAATINASVTQWNGTNVATPATAGYPVVTLKVGTGTGEVNAASGKVPATVAAGDLAANSLNASALATDAVTEIANAVVEAEIDALETYNRTTNTAATITGPTNGATTLTITTDAAYEPIKSIS